MKELSNYINEKLDLDKMNLNDKFPLHGNTKEVIEFLKDNGFKELDDNKIKDFGEYFHEMNKMSAKVYAFTPDDGDSIDSIKFADTTKTEIGNNNPLFHIIYNTESKRFNYQICYKYMNYQYVYKNIFLKNIKQCFGWDI